MQMAVDLDLLGQELERWAAMGTAHTSTEQTASCKAPVQAASPTSDDSTDCGPSAEAEAEVPPQKPKKKRVRRQREELLYLRKKAKQLEDELERLAQREATADGQVAATGTASSLWEGIASRQLQVRCQAEDENRRLKRMLENQLTLARRFECFLRGSGEPTGAAPSPPTGTHCPHQAPVDFGKHCGTSQVSGGSNTCFEDLMDELKVLYMTVDQVIPLVGPRTTTPTVLNAQVLEHPGANGVVIQWTTNVVVPFDWGVTARGLWRFIAHDQVASHVDQVEHHVVSEDMVIRSQIIKIDEGSGAQWRARQVVQRFVEAERTVIVSRSVWVSLDTTPSRLHDARFEENLQLVVCRSTDDGGNSACVKGFTQTLPKCSSKSDTGALTELVLRSVESNMRAMWPVVQSVLIQEDLTQEDWHAAVPST